MYLFKRISDLQAYLDSVRSVNRSFGFVPTMGALHEGHLALVRQSKAENEVTIVSIFVNPTQFNESSDLEKYPRTPAKDIEMLYRVGNQVLFMPDIKEVYPPGDTSEAPQVDLNGLDHTMEGRFRPGHFAGVVQVVHRLLQIVHPNRIYLGQKDYQQFVIIRRMIRQLDLKVEPVRHPIVREPGGLAMSSRNARLSPEQRKQAAVIYRVLRQAREMAAEHTPADIRRFALQALDLPGFRPEYFEIVDSENLQPIHSFQEAPGAVACVAVWAGKVRLIDNVILNGE